MGLALVTLALGESKLLLDSFSSPEPLYHVPSSSQSEGEFLAHHISSACGAEDREAHPIVFRNLTSLAAWRLLPEWSLEGLQQRLPSTLTRVLFGDSGCVSAPLPPPSRYQFHYSDRSRPLARQISEPDCTQVLSCPTIEFFDGMSNKQNSTSRYFSRPFSAAFPSEREPAGPFLALLESMMNAFQPPLERSSELYASVWLGSEGVTTHCHYDSKDNFFFQIQGTKRFDMIPPAASLPLLPYPRLHPWTRQTRLTSISSQDQLSPSLSLTGSSVVLQPGDLLYIPAFYFHHVTALSPSVSANVYTSTPGIDAKADFNVIYRLAVPLSGAWSPSFRAVAGAVFINTLVQGVLAARLAARASSQPSPSSSLTTFPSSTCSEPVEVSDFLFRLLSSRYAPLSLDGSQGLNHCALEEPTGWQPVFCERQRLAQFDAARHIFEAVDSEHRTLTEAVSRFAHMKQGVWDLLLADYVEELALVSLDQNASAVCLFLLECFVWHPV